MPEELPQAVCSTCQTAFAVEANWRLAKCPHCGATVMRMTDDSSYD